MRSFHPFEVVGRGGETQLQVGDILKLDNLALKKLNIAVCKYPVDIRRRRYAGLMLCQRHRRWTNIEPTLGQRLMFPELCAGTLLNIIYN